MGASSPTSEPSNGGSDLHADDRARIEARGLTVAEVERQLALLRRPPPPVRLERPATVGDGILALSRTDEQRCLDLWREAAISGRLTAFVPASGAASRMFRVLLATREQGGAVRRPAVAERAASGDRDAGELLEFLDSLDRFAFHGDLKHALAERGIDLERLRADGDLAPAIEALLDPGGLDYAGKAKGLLAFHAYPDGSRTAFEEHLVEAAEVVRDGRNIARLHFTVSPQHRGAFATLLEKIRPSLEARTGARFEIGFSEQTPSTDTIAIDGKGALFRGPDGALLFRPGGHGSLIANLNRLDADLLLVKNIDNIVPDHLRAICVHWKRVLAGVLVETQAKVFAALEDLERDPTGGPARALDLLATELQCPIPAAVASGSTEERARFAASTLDRPVRICGMVPASGETGGGPFWVSGRDGRSSLQIVETAQIDPNAPGQRAAHAAATHFNPVDLACGLRDRHGQRFDLARHVDPAAAFITEKSSGGRTLRALEHPGLWNGAMADWTTVFVQVPLATFNPVKTVNDLLRKEHQ